MDIPTICIFLFLFFFSKLYWTGINLIDLNVGQNTVFTVVFLKRHELLFLMMLMSHDR